MVQTVFVEVQFWLLVLFSIVVPVLIYVGLLKRRNISRNTVLVFGVVLLLISGVDIYLLQVLSKMAKTSVSHWDNSVFLSELSMALYLLPLTYGGIGVNLISHVLIRHLSRGSDGLSRRTTNKISHGLQASREAKSVRYKRPVSIYRPLACIAAQQSV